MKTDKLFNGLPTWAKGVVAVGVLGIAGFAAFTIYKKLKDAAGSKDTKVVVDENLNEYDKLAKQGGKLSKPLPMYQQAINDIVIKFNGCESVYSELDAIKAIIKVVKKPIDWYYLTAKFGRKDIEDCGSFGMFHQTH